MGINRKIIVICLIVGILMADIRIPSAFAIKSQYADICEKNRNVHQEIFKECNDEPEEIRLTLDEFRLLFKIFNTPARVIYVNLSVCDRNVKKLDLSRNKVFGHYAQMILKRLARRGLLRCTNWNPQKYVKPGEKVKFKRSGIKLVKKFGKYWESSVDTSTRFEMTSKGEILMNNLISSGIECESGECILKFSPYWQLPQDTAGIGDTLIAEAISGTNPLTRETGYTILLQGYLGHGDDGDNKLRIARNLVETGIFTSIRTKNIRERVSTPEGFRLTFQGTKLAKKTVSKNI